MKEETRTLVLETPARALKRSKGDLIEEADGKSYYHSEKPDFIIQEFKSPRPEEGKRPAKSKDLSSLRNEISSYLFSYIEGFHIPTHFVSKLSATAMVIRRTEFIPMTLRVYNVGTGALQKRFGLSDAATIEFPIIEHFYKNGRKPPVWMNEYHMFAMNIVTPDELKQIHRLTSKVNAVLRGLCDRRKLLLADLQLAFGRLKDQLVVADELSPYTCHFVDRSGPEKVDDGRYSPDQDNAVEMFSDLYHRLKLKA